MRVYTIDKDLFLGVFVFKTCILDMLFDYLHSRDVKSEGRGIDKKCLRTNERSLLFWKKT